MDKLPILSDLLQFLAHLDTIRLPTFQGGTLIERAMPLSEAGPGTVSFCGSTARDPAGLLAAAHATLLIVDQAFPLDQDRLVQAGVQAIVRSPSPRLDFIRVVEHFFTRPRPRGVHPTAVVSPEASISPDAYVGAYCVIGQVMIGAGSVIHSGVHMYDGVRIGRNVMIHSGCVIGSDGFGFERNEAGKWVKFPHIGGVVIEDDVEICALTHVARGALWDTVIGQGTKIDAQCHIGHNVIIGQDCVICAQAMVGCSSVGHGVWIAPGAILRNKIHIGNGALVGMGSVVTRDVPDKMTVMGVPARLADEQRRLLKRLADLAAEG